MNRKTAYILWNLLKFFRTGPLMLWIHPSSALLKVGWFQSFHSKKVIDKQGNEIPWWTYPFIDFFEGRIKKEFRVLEFGCGGSTIWLSKRVKEIVSIEDNQKWSEFIGKKLNGGSNLILVRDIHDFNSYNDRIQGTFDIIIIDNMGNRMRCAVNSLPYLSDTGVVVWDNTDGPDWPEIRNFFTMKGFAEISFTGMVAQELSLSRTTVFYRQGNCLSI
jgi:SAM-dependent methyltransferase